jgi:hypothetical protein
MAKEKVDIVIVGAGALADLRRVLAKAGKKVVSWSRPD